MLDIVQIGPFGIFKTADFLRAVPEISVSYDLRFDRVPKLPMEDFRFVIVEKSLIQIALLFTGVEPDATGSTVEKVIDDSNARVTERKIVLDEDGLLTLLGYTEELLPARKNQQEKLSQERINAINLRARMLRVKTCIRKLAEYDQAQSALPDPASEDYQDLFRKALLKRPGEEEIAGQPVFIASVLDYAKNRFNALVTTDDEFVTGLTDRWQKDINADPRAATVELLAECMNTLFGDGDPAVPNSDPDTPKASEIQAAA